MKFAWHVQGLLFPVLNAPQVQRTALRRNPRAGIIHFGLSVPTQLKRAKTQPKTLFTLDTAVSSLHPSDDIVFTNSAVAVTTVLLVWLGF